MRNIEYLEDTQKDWPDVEIPEWMVRAVSVNPDYCGWGPWEDYMWNEKGGWNSRIISEDCSELLDLDELNEVVNFYFQVYRDQHECEACKGSGVNPETKRISDSFYEHSCPYGAEPWNDKITQDEVEALIDKGRLDDFCENRDDWTAFRNGDESKRPKITAEEVNASQGPGNFLRSHDAINRWILIETRAKRLGVWGHCEHCTDGTVYDSGPKLRLVTWVLHPRKGASRGWAYNNVQEEDLPKIAAWLKEADERNRERFSKIGALA